MQQLAKKSKSGAELEFFVIDHEGKIVLNTDSLLKQIKKEYKNSGIIKEFGKHMLEITSYPSVNVGNTMLELLKKLQRINEIVDKDCMTVFPLGSYPGEYNVQTREKKWYTVKKTVLGKDRFAYEALFAGFHYHYTLPRGTFD